MQNYGVLLLHSPNFAYFKFKILNTYLTFKYTLIYGLSWGIDLRQTTYCSLVGKSIDFFKKPMVKHGLLRDVFEIKPVR